MIGLRSHIATANILNRELITMLEYGFRLEGSPKDKHSSASASRDACRKTLPVCGAVGTWVDGRAI